MRRLLILLLMLIPTILLQAVSLQESIRFARENNKELLAQKSGLDSANWAKKNALTNFLPKIAFNATAVRIDDETYDEANEIYQVPVFNNGLPTGDYIPFSSAAMGSGFYKTTFTNDITVQQPIFNGAKVILGYQIAKLAEKQAELVMLDKKKDTDYTVVSTYLGLLQLQDLKTLSRKSLNSTLSHLETVLKKYDVGTAKKSDVLQWQVKMKNDETAIKEIDNSLNQMQKYWQNLLGTDQLQMPDQIEVKSYDAEVDRYAGMINSEIENEITDFLADVEQSSATLQTLAIARKMMNKNYLMAKGNFLPSLNLQYSYQFESDDKFDFDGNDNWNLAAVLSIPIFTGGSNYTNLVKTRHEKKKLKYETEWVEENYLIAAENVLRDLITKAQMVQDNKIALEYARENHQIVNNLYKQGIVTNNELLDAEAMLFGSEMTLISAYYDFILAKYEMKKYTDSEEK